MRVINQRRYDESFKRGALDLLARRDRTIGGVAKALVLPIWLDDGRPIRLLDGHRRDGSARVRTMRGSEAEPLIVARRSEGQQVVPVPFARAGECESVAGDLGGEVADGVDQRDGSSTFGGQFVVLVCAGGRGDESEPCDVRGRLEHRERRELRRSEDVHDGEWMVVTDHHGACAVDGIAPVLWTPSVTRDGLRSTPEYKAEVVRLAQTSGKTAGQLARELDLTETAVRSWIKQAEVDAGKGSDGALTTAEREELAALRREVKSLRMEREILKKATAFFAKETT
jgi:transposase